jgi:hypothetical protein
MATLHIAPNAAAGGGISAALAEAGTDDTVLVNHEDFSYGPIDPAALAQRQSWRANHDTESLDRHPHSAATPTEDLWAHLDAGPDAQPTLWVGRASAQELAFYLYFAARFGDQPWCVIDVTGTRPPYAPGYGDGAGAVTPQAVKPARSVAELHPRQIRLLLDSGRLVGKTERNKLAARWRTLQAENAPLRVVTDAGLSSVPVDYFDRSLIEHTPATPTPMARVIADTMGSQPFPVADRVLHRRLIDMINAGRITAEGNPQVMGECRIFSLHR